MDPKAVNFALSKCRESCETVFFFELARLQQYRPLQDYAAFASSISRIGLEFVSLGAQIKLDKADCCHLRCT